MPPLLLFPCRQCLSRSTTTENGKIERLEKKVPRIDISEQTKKKCCRNSMFKNNHENERGQCDEGKTLREREKERRKKNKRKMEKKNSHKIFIVMLATLLPCLFTTMHEYTPLSVRFNPLENFKAAVLLINSSLASKCLHSNFGAEKCYVQQQSRGRMVLITKQEREGGWERKREIM